MRRTTALPQRARFRMDLRACSTPRRLLAGADRQASAQIARAAFFIQRRVSFAIFPSIILAALALPGCGYHVAGKAVLVPADVRTIAIPAFKNMSHQYRIEQTVTAAIKQEFLQRTQFRITSNPAGADAVLDGIITRVSKGVLTFDPQTGRATTLQIQVAAAVTLEDLHTHKPIYSNSHYTFREEYQISPINQVLFEEDQPAIDRLSRDLARTLVTDILEDF